MSLGYRRRTFRRGLDRLTAAGAGMFGGTDNWHRFTYDALDNLRSWKVAGVKDFATYGYDVNNRLTSIKNTGGATIHAFSHDVQGNVTDRNSVPLDFDFGNRLRNFGTQEHYRYDGLGRRVLAWRPTGGGSTLSMYSQSGQVMYQHSDPLVRTIENVYLAGSLVAAREMALTNGAITVKYQHTDALGSPVAVTSQAGTVIERTNYDPYGGAIGKVIDGVGYTGHVMDPLTGLTNMQQRYYDPLVGRFLSVDPVAARPTGDNFNRYSYAANNPYRFRDPDGREAACVTLNNCGRAAATPADKARLNDALKVTAALVVPGAGAVACASGGCAAAGWAAAAIDAIPGAGKVAGLFGKIGGAVAKALGKADKVGDLTRAENKQIQAVVNQAGRPLDVVGSAASGTRRGVGTDLPIGKGPGTRSDIDYTTAGSNADNFDGLQQDLPSLAPHGILQGTPEPGLPSIRFEPKP